MLRYAGIYRHYLEGMHYLENYNIMTESIGPYKFRINIPVIEKFVSDLSACTEMDLGRLQKPLVQDKKALAVVLANSVYAAIYYGDSVKILDTSDKWKLISSYTVPASGVSFGPTLNQLVPVGFEKTTCFTLHQVVTPARIYFDPMTESIFYKKRWVPLNETPCKVTGKKFYYELVNKPEADGIVQLQGGGCVYLKDGNILRI